MAYSTCNAMDFFHPCYKKICKKLVQKLKFHRKQWEFVYIIHHLYQHKILVSGAKGLGFGVGSEPLSSFFASLNCQILATDAPSEIAYRNGWNQHQQFSDSLDKIHKPEILSKRKFIERVSYKTCDMNNIDPNLKEFDFCWSSCCFEHLGSLQSGFDFVINSVEKTLRIGGVACHTTEFNLSSNEQTLDQGITVIYRKQDIEKLICLLRQRGHHVSDLIIAPNKHDLDLHIDIPPYKQDKHIKLKLADYICTSIGIVVKRGK
ncbi:MAG: class I SAM-dependent methyltransferase [Rickettsiella sp.]|nr:class I SAM-dependent methyltransferase [Rickettsiella sp.]